MDHRSVALGFAALLLSAGGALAHEDHAGHAGQDKVGTVSFANSCAPAVQADLARGVAMLHLYCTRLVGQGVGVTRRS